MLSDLIFLLVIAVSVILFTAAFSWKKKHFVKELYVDKSITFLFVYVFILLIEIVPYLIFFRHQHFVYIYALLAASMDLALLFLCISSITTCVYLENTSLIYQNLFVKKEIDLTGDDVILKEKTDRKVILSKRCRITVSVKHLSGNINWLFYQIQAIVNDSSGNHGN